MGTLIQRRGLEEADFRGELEQIPPDHSAVHVGGKRASLADLTQKLLSIDGVDDAIVDGTQTVTVTATAAGHTDGTDTVDVTDDDVAALTVAIVDASISENGGSTTATISRNTDTTSALTVTLASSDTGEVTVPAAVTIPANQASATFSIDAVDDTIVDGTQTVAIDATATGYVGGSDTLEVLDYMEVVPVGNPGNAPDTRYDPSGYGGVSYEYNIGKYEVTAGQYTEFLNAVADTDTYGLYNTSMDISDLGCQITRTGSSGSYTYDFSGRPGGTTEADWIKRPVNFVSWGDAARFSNWLHNGQPSGPQGDGTTEPVSQEIRIVTNLPGNKTASCIVTGKVEPSRL